VTVKTAANPRLIYVVMLLVPLFWGGAFATTKHVVSELPPLTAAALRFGLAGLLMAGWLVARGGWDWPLIRRRWLGLTALAVTGIFLYNIFFSIAMQYTSAINGALVVVVNPVTTALVAVTLLGEAWSWRLGAGLALSFVGVLITITQGSVTVLTSMAFNYGDLLLVGGVISWTTYTSLGKIVMREVPAMLATTVSTLIGSLLLAIASLPEHGWHKVTSMSSQTAAEMVYLILFATIAAYVLFNLGIRQIGASRASAYINLMPPNAIWIAAVLYGEKVTLIHLFGAALIVSGVLLITYFDAVKQAGSSEAPPQTG